MEKINPFLKWAGGKRWFVHHYGGLIPKKFNRYIEPFLGSGAVFFHLAPENALLGDSNSDLINTYKAIKTDWKLVYRYLREHQTKHSKEHYYKIRKSRPYSIFVRAARFIYLNRTCWNGLYRVNREGDFNVPIGTRSSVIFKDDCFDKVSQTLKNADLVNDDFEILIDQAEKGDFIFVDPPYTVRHNNNSFKRYNEKLFSWKDQERLFQCLLNARNRGSIIVSTNAYHHSVLQLYNDTFKTLSVSRNSCISSNVCARKKCEELVIFTEARNG